MGRPQHADEDKPQGRYPYGAFHGTRTTSARWLVVELSPRCKCLWIDPRGFARGVLSGSHSSGQGRGDPLGRRRTWKKFCNEIERRRDARGGEVDICRNITAGRAQPLFVAVAASTSNAPATRRRSRVMGPLIESRSGAGSTGPAIPPGRRICRSTGASRTGPGPTRLERGAYDAIPFTPTAPGRRLHRDGRPSAGYVFAGKRWRRVARARLGKKRGGARQVDAEAKLPQNALKKAFWSTN